MRRKQYERKSKYIRNLTIGAISGALITGGSTFALFKYYNDTPFIRDYNPTYKVTTTKVLLKDDGIVKLPDEEKYLSEESIEELNKLELKHYTKTSNNYNVEVYGFTDENFTNQEKEEKIKEFKNKDYLSIISGYDYYDEYQQAENSLPSNYDSILEEINIRQIDYNYAIKVQESKRNNIITSLELLLLVAGGSFCGFIKGATLEMPKNKSKNKKLQK